MDIEPKIFLNTLAKIFQVIGLIFTSAGILGENRLRRLERYSKVIRRRVKFSALTQAIKPLVKIALTFVFIGYLFIEGFSVAKKIWLSGNVFEQVLATILIISFILGLLFNIYPNEYLFFLSITLASVILLGTLFFKWSSDLFHLITFSTSWTIIPVIWLFSSQAIQYDSLKEYITLRSNPLNWGQKKMFSEGSPDDANEPMVLQLLNLWLNIFLNAINATRMEKSVWKIIYLILVIPSFLSWILLNFYWSLISFSTWITIKLASIVIAFCLYVLLLTYKIVEKFRLKFRLRSSVITTGVLFSLLGVLLD